MQCKECRTLGKTCTTGPGILTVSLRTWKLVVLISKCRLWAVARCRVFSSDLHPCAFLQQTRVHSLQRILFVFTVKRLQRDLVAEARQLKSTVCFELSNVKSFLRPWRSLRTGRISEADRYGQAEDYGLSVQTKPKTFQLGNPESCLLRGSCCRVSEAFAADADIAATDIQCRFTSCCDVPQVSSSDGGHLAGGVE